MLYRLRRRDFRGNQPRSSPRRNHRLPRSLATNMPPACLFNASSPGCPLLHQPHLLCKSIVENQWITLFCSHNIIHDRMIEWISFSYSLSYSSTAWDDVMFHVMPLIVYANRRVSTARPYIWSQKWLEHISTYWICAQVFTMGSFTGISSFLFNFLFRCHMFRFFSSLLIGMYHTILFHPRLRFLLYNDAPYCCSCFFLNCFSPVNLFFVCFLL